MAVEYLGTGNDDGTVLGRSATDLVAFHNATPSDQAAFVALTTGSSLLTVEAAVQAIRAVLVEKGLMAAS